VETANAELSSGARKAAAILRAWMGRFTYEADSVAPALFDLWWKHFHALTWSDDFGGDSVGIAWPSRSVTRVLLEKTPMSPWFDNGGTAPREGAREIAAQALEAAVAEAVEKAGTLEQATLARLRPVSIPHLLRLPSFGALNLAADGCAECVNAQKGSHGPSWRMAVETGEKPRAWGGYPGGQSGNPGSPAFDAFVENWVRGRPYELLFLENPGEQPDSISYFLDLKGKP
jgi:penicillin amidase